MFQPLLWSKEIFLIVYMFLSDFETLKEAMFYKGEKNPGIINHGLLLLKIKCAAF